MIDKDIEKDIVLDSIFGIIKSKGLPKYGKIEIIFNDKHIDVSRTDRDRIDLK